MINIGICDDDAMDREQIRQFCQRVIGDSKKEEFKITEFSSAKEVLEYRDIINILLLDIEIDDLDGIGLKDKLESGEKVDIIVFVGSHEENMIDAFGRKTRGFLLKPIEIERFESIMGKCLSELTEVFQVPLKSGEVFNSNQIFYIESMRNYTWVHFQDNKVCIRKTLKEWEMVLQQYHFIRVQKSYVVNMGKIVNMKNCIELKNGKQLPLGRVYKKEAKSLYMQYLKGQV